MPIPLHPYQRFAEKWIVDHPYCGLFIPMGLGKTAITLDSLFKINPKGHVLIIAPKNIARSTWIDEIQKWKLPLRTKSLLVDEKGRDLKPAVRYRLYQETVTEPPTVYFINREKIPDLVNHLPPAEKGFIWPFSVVVIDESQSFKNYESERFKALKKVRPAIDRLIELTGTPRPRDMQDLWSQIYLLDQGQRLGKNITAYRDRWFCPGKIVNNYPVTWYPYDGAETEIYRRISDIVISMENTQITLPPITYTDIMAHMSDADMKRYKKFMRTNVLELDSGNAIEATNAGVLRAKLAQMASGSIYVPDENNKLHYEVIHEKKLELTEYLINNANDNVIIAYHFKSEKDMLIKYLTKQGLHPTVMDGKPETIHAFQRGEIPILLLQPASAGHGLNLQDNCHTLIWYTLPDSLEEYLQTTARIYRQRQTHPVSVYRILTEHTVDELIKQNLYLKNLKQDELLQAVRAVL